MLLLLLSLTAASADRVLLLLPDWSTTACCLDLLVSWSVGNSSICRPFITENVHNRLSCILKGLSARVSDSLTFVIFYIHVVLVHLQKIEISFGLS